MRGRSILYVYFISVLAYLAVTFLLPPDAQTMARYEISATALRWLNVGIAVPLILIWGAAFYGYAKLRRYSDTIKMSAEGRAVKTIANGIMVLVIGLPSTNIINKVLRYIGQQHESWMAGFTIATNYVSLVFPLTAFILISVGASGLTKVVNKRLPRGGVHAMVALFACLSVGYCYLVLHFAFSNDSTVGSVYRLPLWLVLLTLVVPYIYTWFIGMMAAYEMLVYNASLKGVLYRKSWSMVSVGLGLIVLSQVIVQCLTTLTRQLSQLHIGTIVGLVYGLLFLMAVGYTVLSFGLKKLQKIEEV